MYKRHSLRTYTKEWKCCIEHAYTTLLSSVSTVIPTVIPARELRVPIFPNVTNIWHIWSLKLLPKEWVQQIRLLMFCTSLTTKKLEKIFMFIGFSGFCSFDSFVYIHHLFLNSQELFIYISWVIFYQLHMPHIVYLYPESDFNVLKFINLNLSTSI